MRQIPSVYSELNLVDEKVEKIIDKNFNRLSPLLYKLLLDWFISAFSNFKDIEKYLILIYLINSDFIFYRKNGIIVDRGTPDDLILKHGRKNLEEVLYIKLLVH